MSAGAAIAVLLVVVGGGILYWKRCDIFPDMCKGGGSSSSSNKNGDNNSINHGGGGTGDQRKPFDTTGKGLSDKALKLAGAKYSTARYARLAI